jgi:RepB DNA-primase N-terminal domain
MDIQSPRNSDRQGDDTARILRFLTALHGNRAGYVGLGIRRGESFRTRLFFWCPIGAMDQHGSEIVEWLEKHEPDWGLYYTPAMFDYPHALRTNISQLRAVWVDCDSADSSNRADSLRPRPTLTILTSPGKTQRLWLITGQGVAPETAAGVNLRLAQLTGGDSCWQANHYLRLPWTHNRKYDPPPLVKITGRTRRYTVDEITAAFPPAELPAGFMTGSDEVAELLSSTPSAEALVRQYRGIVRDVAVYGRRVEGGDRSNGFWGLLKDLARAGVPEGERLALALFVRDVWLDDKRQKGGLWSDDGVLEQVRKAAEAVRTDG